MDSFLARQSEVKGMSKKELKKFITEHDLLFRSWDDEPPPEDGFHRKPTPKTPFHR